jgi:hypothetical protein
VAEVGTGADRIDSTVAVDEPKFRLLRWWLKDVPELGDELLGVAVKEEEDEVCFAAAEAAAVEADAAAVAVLPAK